ncbi:MAG: acyltransferase family protein, partial [Candidatus Sulfotelmatobacter sp.]
MFTHATRQPRGQLRAELGSGAPSQFFTGENSRSRSSYRPDIDGLRAIAIIPVVIFHAFPSIMPGGFVGVDIFFVISGFLISGILLQALHRGTFSFLNFYSNRIKRLFPALLVVLAACLVFGWFFLLPDEYQQLGKHTLAAAAYVENFALRRETGYFDIQSSLKPLAHIWSLGIEEQFYLAYPLILCLIWFAPSNFSRIFRHSARNQQDGSRFGGNAFPAIVALALASFALNILKSHRDPIGDFLLPHTRWWELMVGGVLACCKLNDDIHGPTATSSNTYLTQRILSDSAAKNAFSFVGMLLIAAAILGVRETAPFPGWWALLPVIGAALLILGGPGAWMNRKILASAPLVFIGLISYPFYLWHWPLLTFPRIVCGHELPPLGRFAAIVLSLILATATWRYVENPIRFGRKTWVKTTALVGISVVLGGFGYAAHRDGFSARFPSYIRDVGRLQDVEWSVPQCRAIVGLAHIDYCRIAGGGAPDVLLFGDSHAAVLYDGLAPVFLEHSKTLMNLGESGCVPFYGTDSVSPGVSHQSCAPVLNRIVEFAASSASVRTIVFSFRGPRYLSGVGFGSAEETGTPKQIIWSGAPTNADQAQIFTLAFRDTLARLQATGKNVILFAEWPELGFDPRSCLPRPIQLFSQPRAFCGVSRDQVELRQRAYREIVSSLQKEFPK